MADPGYRRGPMGGWGEVERGAPALAEAVAARFAANRHHVVGTLRPDGAPRLSGTEVTIVDGRVTVGMMSRSRKLHDVERDPRVELHSAPIEDDLAHGDAKIGGRLHYLGPAGDPSSGEVEGSIFELEVDRVSLVRVDGDELDISVWTPGRGLRVMRRR